MNIHVAPPLDAHETAAALGISYDLFIRTRKELEARGFPRPMPLVSRPRSQKEREKFPDRQGRPPLRWCAELVEAWRRGEQVERPQPATPARPQRATRREKEILDARLG